MSPSTTPARRTSRISSEAAAAAAPQTATRRGDRNESQTVLRACEVLKAFHVLGEDLSLTDVIDRTHLPKTTVFRQEFPQNLAVDLCKREKGRGLVVLGSGRGRNL